MSLINDALRQAMDAQRDLAPSSLSSLGVRPVESSSVDRESLRRMQIFGLVLLGIVGVVLGWRWFSMDVAARSEAPGHARPTPVQEPLPATQASAPAETRSGAQTIAQVTAPEPTPQTPTVPSPVIEPPPATTEPRAPVPQPSISEPKLQAIILHPKRPSAMIDGLTLFVGDQYEDMLVVRISREGATVVTKGQTNVMRLLQ